MDSTDRAKLARDCWEAMRSAFPMGEDRLVGDLTVEAFRQAALDLLHREHVVEQAEFEREKDQRAQDSFDRSMAGSEKMWRDMLEAMGIKLPKKAKVASPEERAEFEKGLESLRLRFEEARGEDEPKEDEKDGDSQPPE
jgi:hypothetical protein